MEAPPCNEMQCEESLEEHEITNDLGPAPINMTNLRTQTFDDCFQDMRQIRYGARTLIKVVDDQSCDDPNYQQECEEAMNQGRVIDEDRCTAEK